MMPATALLRTRPAACCPTCRLPLDGGPVLYQCSARRRPVRGADLSTEYQPPAAGPREGPGLCSCPCLCWRGGTGPGGHCDQCRAGQHGGDAVTARFPGAAAAAAAVRDFTRVALGPGHPAADAADVCVTELFANAVSYSRSALPGGTVTVTVEDSPAGLGAVVVTVRDDGAAGALVRAATPGALAEHGRGLRLVDDWGAIAGPGGRAVWFRCGGAR